MAETIDLLPLSRALSARIRATAECAQILHQTFPPGSTVHWRFAGEIWAGRVARGGVEAFGNRLCVIQDGAERTHYIRPDMIIGVGGL
ncbi:hypothetical protein [Paenirhodobacter populi]|uniref:hypothetical protein n=1 Tax=Paenirhodobacter populi TaxID=2306993 RepID=UPI000FE40D94|nr:hypothetical protein [Sinirhodobacter populi]RWR09727.1 hypothetical protein D2T32_05120 [Sinirhodobacter populi]